MKDSSVSVKYTFFAESVAKRIRKTQEIMKEQNMLIEPTKMMKITEAKQTKKTSKMRSILFGRGTRNRT